MADDIAALIGEIEALRAELRAALSDGQGGTGQLGSEGSSKYSPAANAIGLHQLSSKGFVSGLTGQYTPPSNKTINILERDTRNYATFGPAIRGVRYMEFGEWDGAPFESSYETRMGVGSANPANTGKYSYGMPSWYRKTTAEMRTLAWHTAEVKAYNPSYQMPARLTNAINKIEHQEAKSMLRHQINAAEFASNNQYGKTGLGRLWKKSVGKYTKAGAMIGGLMSGVEALKSLDIFEDDIDKAKYLTDAEKRAGMSVEDRFGKLQSPFTQILIGASHTVHGALSWAAMATWTERMATDSFTRRGALALREAGKSWAGFTRPMNKLTAVGQVSKGLLWKGGGFLKAGINPVSAALAAWSLGDLWLNPESDLNTWDKRREESDKKLKSQLDDMVSYDVNTARQKIDSVLNKNEVRTGAWSTFGRGAMSFLGLMDSPAQREDRIRAKISDKLAQAAKRGEESLKDAKLGNIAKATIAIKEAREMAGDLVPVDWMDPMRVFTMQEQASRSKACFSRYLNNRVTSRTGD
jgi:hypothetical protein